MSGSRSLKHGDRRSYHAYLLHVLEKRNVQLNSAYQHIVQSVCQTLNVKTDAFVQTDLATVDVALQTADCDECSSLRETVENVKQQLSDSIQSAIRKDNERLELEKQLSNSAELISDLRARADAEEAARKAKEEQAEELEELIMVCKSESLATEQEQHNLAENRSRENESLKLELRALKASLQTKEEALAQNLLEKDDLEDTNRRLQATNTSLLHQLDELRLQMKNRSVEFERDVHHLADEKQRLMDTVQNLNAELDRCQQSASVPFGCSQPVDPLASQQSNELSSVKLELLAVQAEKDDLIQQLHQCKDELASHQFHSCQPSQSLHQDSKNNTSTAPFTNKPSSVATSREQLESQNAALLGQLLILEDQLAESERLLMESGDGRQQGTDQLKTALEELPESSARVTGLEREKLALETELDAAKTSLEVAEDRLQECKTQLSLVEGKLSSAGNRQRQLLSHKQVLESQNRELLLKLQCTEAASVQHVGSLHSHPANMDNLEYVSSHAEGNENRAALTDKASETCDTFGDVEGRQITRMFSAAAVGGADVYRAKVTTDPESQVRCGTAISTSVDDRRLVACTTSPAELLDVCETPKSVHSDGSRSATGSLKRRIAECSTEIGSGGKQHLGNINHEPVGQWLSNLFSS